MKITLRDDYQVPAVERARELIRSGAKRILMVAPTGAGKSVMGSALMEMTSAKGNRATWVVDRLSLVNQISRMFSGYGLEHGVLQGQHPNYRPSLPIQVCSAQTLSKRGWPESHVDMIDEAHVLHEVHKQRIAAKASIVLGFTATPFTKGLGRYFDEVINVTTTRTLIEQGWLVPYRAMACVEPDMEGVATTSMGEWEEAETSKRALQVVGDVVKEYLAHGDGRKFICSGVDTAHCDELARQFTAAGVPVAVYTYKVGDEEREEITEEFRRHDSSIRGLITVTAASRGFDIPDVACIIAARPLRKSLAEWIQLIGRGLRISPDTGKKDCLILDHSGNCIASGMRVLTRRGQVPIEQIQPDDEVWDGHEFVRHGGLINRGVRRVIRYAGLTATPDHRVKTLHGWRTFGACAEEQTPIVTTGIGGAPVRECEGHLTGLAVARPEGAALCACAVRVHRVWLSVRDLAVQLARRADQGMQGVQPAPALPKVAVCAGSGHAAAVREPQSRLLRQLRRTWNRVQVQQPGRVCDVDRGDVGAPGQRAGLGVGPDRLRWSLRSGEPALGDPQAQHEQPACGALGGPDAPVPAGAPADSLRRRLSAWVLGRWDDLRADRAAVAHAVEEAEGQVWDLLDCGPRNSFTCEGLLVHNCARFFSQVEAFFDCGLERLHMGKPKEKMSFEEKPLEPVKCPQCRSVHKPAPTCPVCGHEYPRRKSVQHVEGTMVRLGFDDLLRVRDQVVLRDQLWPQLASWALSRKGGDEDAAQRLAQAVYKDLTGEFCRARVATTKLIPPSPELLDKMRRRAAAHAIRRQYAERRSAAA